MKSTKEFQLNWLGWAPAIQWKEFVGVGPFSLQEDKSYDWLTGMQPQLHSRINKRKERKQAGLSSPGQVS